MLFCIVSFHLHYSFISEMAYYSYEKEQERLEKLMEECMREDYEEIESLPDDDEDEGEEDAVEVQDVDTDTEQDISDSEPDTEVLAEELYFTGKDNETKWGKHQPPTNVRTRAENLVKHLPGPKRVVKDLKTPLLIWKYFFNDEMLSMIVEYTNQRIQSSRENYGRERDARETNILEIQVLFGLLYLSGVLKSNRLHIEELWRSNGTGVEVFRLVMSQQRFKFLLRHLRFDNMLTREERKLVDKLAPIREIFGLFVDNCKTAFTPFEYVTVDEKLEGFRGRCSFRQYIPSKPNKYGIKIFALADAKTFYTVNMEVYVGKQPQGPYAIDNSPKAVVERLCEPIKGTGRNVTLDNWFTSMDLVETLSEEFKLTVVGTIRKNKRQLPQEFVNPKGRPVGASMFGYHGIATLVSYIPKKNKNVLLLSSLHRDGNVDPATGKPEIILDYNSTKGGVDCVDKLCASYNCARNTRRWPVVVFYSLLNVAGINTMIIFSANNPENIKRREFLRRLSFEMMDGHLRARVGITSLPRSIRERIRDILGIAPRLEPLAQGNPNSRGRCVYCDRTKNRPTRFTCKKCGKYICVEHSLYMCSECYMDHVE